MNPCLLQHLVFAHNQAYRDLFIVVEIDLVVFDGALCGSAAVFGGCRGREVPFYKAGATDEGDVVQVDNTEGEFESRLEDGMSGRHISSEETDVFHTLLAFGTGRVPNVSACAFQT